MIAKNYPNTPNIALTLEASEDPSIIPSGDNVRFHYTLLSYSDNDEIIQHENGIGYIYQQDDQLMLSRTPINRGKKIGTTVKAKPDCEYLCNNKTFFHISSPLALSNMLFCDNCIITSKCCSTPISLCVNNYSLLGRLGGDIAAISLNDPELINNFIEGLCKYTKQLSLKTSKLDAKSISTLSLQLKHNANTNVKKGTMIYDEDNDTIKFYNGTKWRTLMWVDENGSE